MKYKGQCLGGPKDGLVVESESHRIHFPVVNMIKAANIDQSMEDRFETHTYEWAGDCFVYRGKE